MSLVADIEIPNFTRPSMVDKVVSPEDEIFWREVRIAYDMVSVNGNQQIKVQRGSKEATVKMHPTQEDFIVVGIRTIVPDPPKLVVPSGHKR